MAVTKVMAASLTDERNRQMKAEVIRIPVEDVEEGQRQRPVNPATVAEIYRSIEQVGLLQPISVKYIESGPARNSTGYQLIAGAHRLRAWRQKLDEAAASDEKMRIGRWSHIPAILYPVDMPADLIAMVEVQENLVREDLSAEQRLAFGGKYLQWMLRQEEKEKEAADVGDTGKATSVKDTGKATSVKPSKKGPAPSWFTTWYEAAKIPKKTADRTWDRFLTETERAKVTPGSKEGAALRETFAAWAKAAKAKPIERVQAAQDAQAAEQVREAARKIPQLKARISKDFGELLGLVGSSAAAAFAVEMHDTACAGPSEGGAYHHPGSPSLPHRAGVL